MRRVLSIPILVACGAAIRPEATKQATDMAKKMEVLVKLLKGETTFKNNALLKDCNVELMFGKNWKKELEDYSRKLPKDEKVYLDQQIKRLDLTRYTTRELAEYGVNGSNLVEDAAYDGIVQQGLATLEATNEATFIAFARNEARLSNWPEEKTAKLIDDVMARKKA